VIVGPILYPPIIAAPPVIYEPPAPPPIVIGTTTWTPEGELFESDEAEDKALARFRPRPRPAFASAPASSRSRRADRERAEERLKVGDRLFRAGELVRAAERYEQSIEADPSSAAPFVRLSQIALARGRYAEAADRLREAQAAQPGWMARREDPQNLFGDPAKFAAVVARLESHLQAHPDDRDAWMVLGAEMFLSGRAQRAADIFLRLTDRAPDATLAGFLQATGSR
jgi:tetratricopeptide (TPR) repeat protein